MSLCVRFVRTRRRARCARGGVPLYVRVAQLGFRVLPQPTAERFTLTQTLLRRGGCCLGRTSVYVCAGAVLGLPVRPILFEGHVASAYTTIDAMRYIEPSRGERVSRCASRPTARGESPTGGELLADAEFLRCTFRAARRSSSHLMGGLRTRSRFWMRRWNCILATSGRGSTGRQCCWRWGSGASPGGPFARDVPLPGAEVRIGRGTLGGEVGREFRRRAAVYVRLSDVTSARGLRQAFDFDHALRKSASETLTYWGA